jgi:hypothetical protein
VTEDIDEIYRRASAFDPSRPTEALRRKVLDHAAALTAVPPPAAAHRARSWRPAVCGSLAAAGIAGLLIVPRVFNPHPPAESAPQPPPQAAAESSAIARSHERPADQPAADAGAAPASAPPAPPTTDREAALRQAAATGDLRKVRAMLGAQGRGAQVRIDAADARGRTALMLATLRGQAESVDVLLAHGADPNAADATGTTPLQAALAADQPAIVAALRRSGAR